MPNATLLSPQDTLHLLDTVIGQAQEAIIIADAQETIRCINAAGAQSLGLSARAAVGKKLADVASSVPDALRQLMVQVQLDGVTRHAQVAWPDGSTFHATLVSAPGLGTLTVLHNAARFKQRDWMELVAAVSHDLKSPLSVLGGYAHVLAESPELTPQSREYVRAVLENADRMRDLIESLLDLAQVEVGLGGDIEPCDLLNLMSNVHEMLDRQAQDKQQTLIFELAPVSQVLGNPMRLTQVVYNLVGNAIKYTPPGGKITVKTEEHAEEIRFTVTDNGPGIAPAAQARLFQRFYRVAGAASGPEGTGLGLAIVKSIVESYGGRVWVESQMGEGSTFGFALPIKPGNPAR